MVYNIAGIGAQPELTPVRPAKDRAKDTESQGLGSARDGVEISDEAKQASEVTRFLQLSKQQSEIRDKQVEEARKNIQQGTYKLQAALLGVSAKMMPFLE